MKYFYEYKEKNGTKVAGSNLEKIDSIDNFIILRGIDTIQTINDYEVTYWRIFLDMNGIEYLRIWPMLEENYLLCSDDSDDD